MAADAANPSSAAAPMPIRGAEILPQHWIPDERDGFISWLRGEFAAANAIIDALCQHLQMTGSPGEYDLVLACIQQRRFSWNPILHMQHYYSVAEVLMALQQVSLKKLHHAQASEKLARSGSGKFSEFRGSNDQQNKDLREPCKEIIHEDISTKHELLEDQTLSRKVSTLSVSEEAASKSSLPAANFSPKYIVGLEDVEGEQVNVLEGLEVYENVADTAELLAAMTRSHIMKSGEGRKQARSIQFGTIPSEIISEEQEQDLSSTPREEIVAEGGLPPVLDSLLECVLKIQAISPDKRPNSCSISVFEPEDFMLLRAYHSFDQPVYMVSLSQSFLTFGRDLSLLTFQRNLEMRSAGKLFNLTLPPGSFMVLQRNSMELVQCAVSPSQSRQVLIAFGRLKAQVESSSRPQGLARQSIPTNVPARQSSQGLEFGRGVPGWSLGTGVFLPANGVASHTLSSQANGPAPSRAAPAREEENGVAG